MRTLFRLLVYLFVTVHLGGCGPRKGVSERTPVRETKTVRITRLAEPSSALTLPLGKEIPVRLTAPDTVEIDSIQLFLGGELMETVRSGAGEPIRGSFEATLATSGQRTGKSGLRLRIFFGNGTSENQSQSITFLSDLVPQEYTYRVVHEYPHDPEAYTQGLEFVDGWLYEGTGNRGSSSLRRVNLTTGEVVQIRNLDQSLFGEGITVFGNRIYQVTYTSQVGFIYDKATFEEIQKVYYQNREGWGLTNNGEELIMSDGTNVIYFLDPELFTVNRQIEVYDHEKSEESLNELEYIDGKIWANRYYTDEIVIIDPETGKVEGRINLKGILKISDREPNTDVLNGIAWDRKHNRIFVTGKYWPLLFEITPVPLS
ncbi:MAG: glutaminyl-peptide cyclotransferase [Bacteroidales bacterium]